ncbi:MAG: recombinase family protein [Lachnospiraceae bacterium]|nr:recombinase family protein [Lachnospiraceae bacterium]MBP3458916.1 recombinase family protein [Lachnospiraceae bacterium]
MIAIYVRQSLDKKDSLSIESQIEDCISLCKRSGWEEYKIYKDKGWSAKNLDRPSFQQLNKDVEAGLIQAVVCYKIDRISRNIRDLVNLIEDYSELGVHFVSFADNINTAAPGGMMMATLFGSLAQMEREAIITRVTDNYYYRCEQGYWGGGPAPYGFHLKKIQENGQKHTVLEADEEESAVVRKFFDWYLEPDGTVFYILNKANELGIKTRKGAEWTSRVVSELLSKPVYAPNTMDVYNFYASQGVNVRISPEQCDGSLSLNVFGKRDRGSKQTKRSRPVSEMTLALAKHKAIVDSNTFLRVQFKKKSKLASSPRTGTSKTTILSGLVKCGVCGRAMSPSNSRGNVKYFTCSGKRNYASGTCDSKSIKVQSLEEIVIQDMISYFTEPNIISKFHSSPPPQLSSVENLKINALQQEIAKINTDIEHLLDAVTSGNNKAIEYLNRRIESLDEKKNRLNQEILSIRNESNNVLHLFNDINIETLPEILQDGEFEEQRHLCQCLIKKITFNSPEDIIIEYAI